MLGKHVSAAIYCNLRQSKLKERQFSKKSFNPAGSRRVEGLLWVKTVFFVSFDTTGNVNMHIYKYRNIHNALIFSDYCLFMFLCFFSSQWSWSFLSLSLASVFISHHVSLSLLVSARLCVPASPVKVSFSCSPHLVSALCVWFSVHHVSVSSLLLAHTSGFILIVLVLSNLSHVLLVFLSSLFPV